MFISLGRGLCTRLSSQPTLQSLTGTRLIQILCCFGLCPILQHSWRAEWSRVKRDCGGIFACAFELVMSAFVPPLAVFEGKEGSRSTPHGPITGRTTGSVRSLPRQIQNPIDFKSQETNVFTSSSTQPSGEHKQSERNKRLVRVIICAVTLQ